MAFSDIIFRVHVFLAMTIALILPVYQKIVPLLIALWAVTFFGSRFSKKFEKHFISFKTGLVSIVFLIICSITLLYTEHWDSGVFDIESKLSFFIFPLVLSSSAYYYTKKDIQSILLSFVIGLFLGSLFCLYLGFYRIIALDAPFQYLTYIDLSVFMHPSYFSMYLCFGVLIVYHIWRDRSSISNKLKVLFALLIGLFTTMIMLLSSKAGIMILFVIFGVVVFDLVKNKVRLIAILGVAAVLLSVVFFTNDRFQSMRESLSNIFNQEEKVVHESNELRATLWMSATDLLKSNWFLGVGGGDLKYVLTEKSEIVILDQNGNRVFFNAHNQWLETFLSYGLIGLTLMILWLVFPLYNVSRSYKVLMLGLFFIIFLNSIFESVFNRQEGIVFLVFFWTLIASRSRALSKEPGLLIEKKQE